MTENQNFKQYDLEEWMGNQIQRSEVGHQFSDLRPLISALVPQI